VREGYGSQPALTLPLGGRVVVRAEELLELGTERVVVAVRGESDYDEVGGLR